MNIHRQIIATLLILVLAPLGALGQYDKTWSGPDSGVQDWFTGGNWSPPGAPAATDTVLIAPQDTCPEQTLTVEIAGQDAACEKIDMQPTPGAFLVLLIKGQTLTLGDTTTPIGPTTSTLDGDIIFKKNGDNPARLEVHDWVTITVPENGFCKIEALEVDNSGVWAEFLRGGSDGVGVKFVEGLGKLTVNGHFQFLISVEHDATLFGVDEQDSIMKFGLEGADPFVPDLEISGPTPPHDRKFDVLEGSRMEFHEVDFASNSPSWLVGGANAEIRVTNTLNNVPNDITLTKFGLLNLRGDFICNGKLTHEGHARIRVKAGKLATFVAP